MYKKKEKKITFCVSVRQKKVRVTDGSSLERLFSHDCPGNDRSNATNGNRPKYTVVGHNSHK